MRPGLAQRPELALPPLPGTPALHTVTLRIYFQVPRSAKMSLSLSCSLGPPFPGAEALAPSIPDARGTPCVSTGPAGPLPPLCPPSRAQDWALSWVCGLSLPLSLVVPYSGCSRVWLNSGHAI